MIRMSRRSLSAWALAWAIPGRGRAAPSAPHLAIADISGDVGASLKDAPRRFEIYKDLGFSTLRSSVRWNSFEPFRSKWEMNTEKRKYLEVAVKSGMKLKLEIGVWSSAPGWFFDSNPDAILRNGHGVAPRTVISPWYPGIAALMAEKQEKLIATLVKTGLFENIAAVIASLGPAAEPIYPALWEIDDKPPQTFWFGGQNVQATFAAAMKTRFAGKLDAANARWGTKFAGWNEVVIPEPGASHGARWEDVLVWYRDSKRAVIESTLASLRTALSGQAGGGDKAVIMLVPGTHIAPEQWAKAIASGDGDASVKVMIDTDYLLDLAKQTGASLQYTAGQNEKEIKYILAGMRTRGMHSPIWAENAGGKPALDPGHLADVVVNNHLYGLDYINASALFEADHITPGPVFAKMQAASARMRKDAVQ